VYFFEPKMCRRASDTFEPALRVPVIMAKLQAYIVITHVGPFCELSD